ncbi:hypothetical protein IEQ34_001097 [Dendrobium chrysotoxum]|uniref:Ubiquitin-like protease family profile domain-containing protein n=1 Tax=Dendrobium chrysotoxum TaxID=161865 RepID=A0AAV7HMR0_DENCH|nr:hypothetical protein IEQ34_001097 [Dendrobium chrysotoxum]
MPKTQNSFDHDTRLWPVQTILRVLTQKNSVDCRMYICKYMKAVIQSQSIVWVDLTNWQDNMPKFRAEFAYAILCATKN